MKCVSFRWIDPEWDIRTLKVLEKLMEMKGKAEEEARRRPMSKQLSRRR
jgi:hypothetical protein